MLIRPETFAAIKAGDIDTQFRRWTRPTVKAGGTLTNEWGVLAIDLVEAIELDAVSADDLRRAGIGTREELASYLAPEGQLYRVRLHYAGEDPRLALREKLPDAAELAMLTAKLAKLDGKEPWTGATLALIAEFPEKRASSLAKRMGMDQLPFKVRVRKLKTLGLTESLEIGYRLSPRGAALLAHISAP
ncbi:MAG: hypothetical protein EOP22_04675 [Hyphomicrobiales bacterium]|nr:MAG: hypothetical protein EOP22_04675 [Hyphomicrobiales bacterium]